jgi:hypothetical protein
VNRISRTSATAAVTPKSRRSAEVLVPDRVPPQSLWGAYVSCEAARRRCLSLRLALGFSVDSDLFFLP